MKNIDLNQLRDRAYQCALDHGFHEQELSNEHFLMLVITELSEAVEADRKGRRADKEAMIDTIEAGGWHWGFFEEFVKDTIEDELADAVIRLLDLAGLRNIDISDTFVLEHVVFEDNTFPENCFAIIGEMTSRVNSFEDNVCYVVYEILELANLYNIDLLWHIEQKMKYNELCEYKHNKKY